MNSYGLSCGAFRSRVSTLLLAGWAICLLGDLPRDATATPGPVAEVRERGLDGVTFIVEVPELRTTAVEIAGRSFTAVSATGFGLTAEPGLPMLPFRTFTVAVPPGYEPAPQVRVLEANELDLVPAPSLEPEMSFSPDGIALPGFREVVDAEFYGSTRTYPALRFTSAPLAYQRQQQVFDLTVYPVRYDAGRRRLQVARRLEVRVDFRPRAGAGAARLAAPSTERGFESIYRGTIVNYQHSRGWRQGPVIAKGGPERTALFQNAEWKLAVRQSGLVRIGFADLPDFPAGVAIDELVLDERSYVDGEGVENFVRTPVAIEVGDANGNDIFDAGDSLVFYGRNHRDRFGPDAYLNRYTYDNVYWLTWETGGGARITTRDGWPGHGAPTVPASFADTLHIEEDIFNYEYAPHPVVSPAYAARESVNPWYMTNHNPSARGGWPNCHHVDPNCVLENHGGSCVCAASDFPFAVWGMDTGQPLRLRAQLVSAADGFDHLISFSFINGLTQETPVVSRWSFTGHLAVAIYESDPLLGSILTEGANTVRFRGERTEDGGTNIYARALAHLDWCELLYSHLYTAHDNLLYCDTGSASGEVEIRIDGFTAAAITVYDLTDPTTPVALSNTQISESGGGFYEVRFQDTISSRRRYVAFVPGGSEQAPYAISADQTSNLAAPAIEPDLIMVVHDDFEDLVQPLKSHREAQGHTVEVARISDVYDEFDGGLARAFAIRNYLRHAFRTWTRPPLYLLLVGDGNIDFKDRVETGINLVPSYPIYGPVRGDVDLEIVTTDTWFVCGLAPDDEEFDRHLDMHVGRLTVQTREECEDNIDKILAYEQFEPDDHWRASTLTIADDDWSRTISFTDTYRQRSSEAIFELIPDVLNDMVDEEYGGLIDTRAWKLRHYSDQLPEEGRQEGYVTAHIDTTGLPILYDNLISEGNLLVLYQGHANRQMLAHERIFASEFGEHQNMFNNLGRPGVWFLFSCHANDFDRMDERVADLVGGRERTTGELLMEIPQGGVIGSLASTGFEWLPGGVQSGPPFQYDLNTPVWQAFFQTPPIADPAGNPQAARWRLGEVITHAKQIYDQQDSFKGPIFSYVLLGDPALRMDAVPPTFSVTAADTVRQDGDRLEVYGSDSDTVLVVVDIRDEISISEVEVLEVSAIDGSSRPAEPALVAVDTLGPASTPTRHLVVSYSAPLRPDSYDIVIRAEDATGRRLERTLAVRADVSIQVDGVPFQEGDYVAGNAELAIVFHAPVPIASDGIELLVGATGGARTPFHNLQVTQLDALGKDWRATGELNLSGGSYDLVLELAKHGATELQQSWQFNVTGSGELSLQQVAVYPNPFADRTTFNYQLTNWAERVRIRVYTISGRLVAELDGANNAGYSQIQWDGRDRDHDPVANGVYIYRIEASGGGRQDTFTDKLVRSRR